MPRNISDTLVTVLRDVMNFGEDVQARGQRQKELRAYTVRIERPFERVMIVKGRNNNIFAQLAETLWVLAGRNDMKFLSLYLPRAVEFSDDGLTWRAAYGPRIRRWGGTVDQLKSVRERLREDCYSKRAVISIFDPGQDYGETKDVPCNNIIQFLFRGGKLHCNVCVRANDAIWGFSGINAFEWSVIHEMMANSIGREVGEMNWFAGSMHVYDRHYDIAQSISSQDPTFCLYDFGIGRLPVSSTIDDIDIQLAECFRIEAEARRSKYIEDYRDLNPFFAAQTRLDSNTHRGSFQLWSAERSKIKNLVEQDRVSPSPPSPSKTSIFRRSEGNSW